MTPMGNRMWMRKPSLCEGAPTISISSILDTLGTCASGDGWEVTLSFAASDTTGNYEIEIWSKRWEDSDAEPAYTFYSREDITETSIVRQLSNVGTDGAGTAHTGHMKFEARIVHATTAEQAGPFCNTDESSQIDEPYNLCTIQEKNMATQKRSEIRIMHDGGGKLSSITVKQKINVVDVDDSNEMASKKRTHSFGLADFTEAELSKIEQFISALESKITQQ